MWAWCSILHKHRRHRPKAHLVGKDPADSHSGWQRIPDSGETSDWDWASCRAKYGPNVADRHRKLHQRGHWSGRAHSDRPVWPRQGQPHQRIVHHALIHHNFYWRTGWARRRSWKSIPVRSDEQALATDRLHQRNHRQRKRGPNIERMLNPGQLCCDGRILEKGVRQDPRTHARSHQTCTIERISLTSQSWWDKT